MTDDPEITTTKKRTPSFDGRWKFSRRHYHVIQYCAFDITGTLNRYNLDKNQVKRMYYKDEEISLKNCEKFVKLYTELNIAEDLRRFFHNTSARELDSSTSLYKLLVKDVPPANCISCGQFDELCYFFKPRSYQSLGIPYFEKGSKEYRIMEQATEMWANFSTYGRPTVDVSKLIPVHWTPVNDDTVISYLNIDEAITMESTISMQKKLLSRKPK